MFHGNQFLISEEVRALRFLEVRGKTRIACGAYFKILFRAVLQIFCYINLWRKNFTHLKCFFLAIIPARVYNIISYQNSREIRI